MAKAQQLQIRVSANEKATLRRLACKAGMDLSSYVLGRALPSPTRTRFSNLISALKRAESRKHVFAEINSLLSQLAPVELREISEEMDFEGLPLFEANYLAAMIEHTFHLRGKAPPSWAKRIPPLAEPWFATELQGLRIHLLRASPVAFKRRNLFIDSTVGDQV